MADGIRYVDHSAEVKARIVREMGRRVYASCVLVSNRAKESVSVAYPPASSPGQPPAKRTGHLRRSIAIEATGLVGRVGTNVTYGRHLELGTHAIAARPWLRPALMQSQQRIEAILGAPIV